jgi:hypothetical protein
MSILPLVIRPVAEAVLERRPLRPNFASATGAPLKRRDKAGAIASLAVDA